MTTAERCEGCGKRVPDWPAGWKRTDDDRNFCPQCKQKITPLPDAGRV